MTIDKALRGIYKLGGIVFDAKTTTPRERVRTAHACNVSFYLKRISPTVIKTEPIGGGYSEQLSMEISDYLTQSNIKNRLFGNHTIYMEENVQ